jgi:IS5 family transposase
LKPSPTAVESASDIVAVCANELHHLDLINWRNVTMANRKKKASKKGRRADRTRISGKQAYEVAYVARKFGVSAAVVRAAIKNVGNMRAKVYAELEKST